MVNPLGVSNVCSTTEERNKRKHRKRNDLLSDKQRWREETEVNKLQSFSYRLTDIA